MSRQITRALLVGVVVLASTVVGACTDDADDPADPPEPTTSGGLDRIDGPASVDPSYDPFTTDG